MPTPTFLPHHAIVTAPSANPSRYMFVLHGIFGTGGNFRSFIRRLAESCPHWGFVLVDLRGHGMSLGAPPPHTIESSAQDLVHLGQHLALNIRGIMGHSFGGKVTLQYAALCPDELDEVWVLDSTPSTRVGGMQTVGAAHVLDTLDALPTTFSSREFFIDHMTASGMDRPQIEWLAMNVRRRYFDQFGVGAVVGQAENAKARSLGTVVVAPIEAGVDQHLLAEPRRIHTGANGGHGPSPIGA